MARLVTPVPAPCCETEGTSVAMLVIADVSALSADPDLAQQSEYPAWSPQRIQLSTGEATAQAFVCEDEDGVAHTISVLPGIPFSLNRPIRTIDESASGKVQVIAEWFDPHGATQWNTDDS